MVEEKKEQKERFVVTQVVTQTAPAIIDTTKPEDSDERIVATLPTELEGLAKTEAMKLNNQEKILSLMK